jgi:hypothetical protein
VTWFPNTVYCSPEELIQRIPPFSIADSSAGRVREYLLAAVPLYMAEFDGFHVDELMEIAQQSMFVAAGGDSNIQPSAFNKDGEEIPAQQGAVKYSSSGMDSLSGGGGAAIPLSGLARAIACACLVRPEGLVFLGVHWRKIVDG